MHIPRLWIGALLLVSACFLGCSTSQGVILHPVESKMPPESGDVYDISKVEVPPRAVHRTNPQYPFELRRDRVIGKSVIVFTVRTDGCVEGAMILKATDIQFGEAAMAAILKWRFMPAMIGGRPVKCRMVVPISFDISDD